METSDLLSRAETIVPIMQTCYDPTECIEDFEVSDLEYLLSFDDPLLIVGHKLMDEQCSRRREDISQILSNLRYEL